MKRPIAVSSLTEDEALCLPFSSALKSSHSYRDENTSPYNSYHHTHSSDTESLSDGSKKIRKKRNTYQKISDEIRVDLLESVQNGETLKAAAKRHRINYSSAKSILHTYRKEGRILKKSAQERTIKRKSSVTEDAKQANKVLKSCKKDNIKTVSKSSRNSRRGLNFDKINSDLVDSFLQDKDEVKTATTVSDKNCNGLSSKTDYYLPEQEDKDNYQPLTIAPSYHLGHPIFAKEEESTIKMLLNNEGRAMMDHTLKNVSNGHHEHEEDNTTSKYRLYDNFYMNQGGVHIMEGANAQVYGESPERGHAFLPREFESFNDMMNPLQPRQPQFDDYHHNSNSFLNPRKFNTFSNKMDYEGHDDHSTFFLDPQRLFQESMAKASLVNYAGNMPGFRKKSHDFY